MAESARPRVLRSQSGSGQRANPEPVLVEAPELIEPWCQPDPLRRKDFSFQATPRTEPDFAAHQVSTVVAAVDAKRLTETRRSSSEVARSLESPSFNHQVQTLQWFDRANQDRSRDSIRFAYDIAAKVHAVSEVNVQMTGRAKHHRVALRLAPESVAAGIDWAAIGLNLNDSSRGNTLV